MSLNSEYLIFIIKKKFIELVCKKLVIKLLFIYLILFK